MRMPFDLYLLFKPCLQRDLGRYVIRIPTSAHFSFFFFNDTATPDLYPLPLPDALPIFLALAGPASADLLSPESGGSPNADKIDTLYWIIFGLALVIWVLVEAALIYSLFKFRARRGADRKSTRLNSSHLVISYAVFCLTQ